MTKPAFAICQNKGADQPAHLRSLISTFVVHCLDSIIPLVSTSEISSLYLASLAVQAGLCLTWLQTPKTGFTWTQPSPWVLLWLIIIKGNRKTVLLLELKCLFIEIHSVATQDLKEIHVLRHRTSMFYEYNQKKNKKNTHHSP